MRPTVLLLVAFLATSPVWGQGVITKMSEGTCECLEKHDIGSKGSDALQMELGLCLIEQVGLHEKELKKAGYDTQSSSIYERLGEKVGLELALGCPEFMAAVSNMLKDEDSDLREKVMERLEKDEQQTITADLVVSPVFSGEVTAVGYGDFVKISVKDVDGKRKEFYWMGSFEGDESLMALENLDALIGKSIQVWCYQDEVYFYKLKTYLGINRITKLQIL